jgi:uncharacterized protein with LGFP repeats
MGSPRSLYLSSVLLLALSSAAAAQSGLPRRGVGEPPVTHHDGWVVQHPKVFLVFWGPKWTSDATHQRVSRTVEDTFNALPGTQYHNILTQYHDTTSGSPDNAVHNDVTWVASARDAHPPPGNLTVVTAIESEATNQQDANHWPVNKDTVVLVFPQQGSTYLGSGFCGMHFYNDGHQLAYGFARWSDAGSGCVQSGDVAVDTAAWAVHEYAEAVTDPHVYVRTDPDRVDGSGWHTDEGIIFPLPFTTPHEIADLCEDYGFTSYLPGAITVPYLWSQYQADHSGNRGCVLGAGQEFYSPDTTAPFDRTHRHTVQGAILGHYQGLCDGQQCTGVLGAPMSEESVSCLGGDARYSNFEKGRIFFSGPTDPHEVHGAILSAYGRAGWECGALGLPTTDELGTCGGGRYNQFQTGRILFRADSGAHEVHGVIGSKYAQLGEECGSLGFPTSDESPSCRAGGRYNNFQNGRIFFHPDTGAHEVNGAILGKYQAMGSECGVLAFPTSDESDSCRAGGRYNNFQNGRIFFHPDTGAHEVHGAILGKYQAMGAECGVLAFPTSDESPSCRAGGRYNEFQNGRIFFHPDLGAHEVHGAILGKYQAMGSECGVLAFPTSDESESCLVGARFSDFQGGRIFFTPQLGAHQVQGAILGRYGQLGSECGQLGLPRTDESASCRAGGRFNDFVGGRIMFSPATGAFEVFNDPVGDRWAQLGNECSGLGFPLGPEVTTAAAISQRFENGVIRYDRNSGAVDVFPSTCGGTVCGTNCCGVGEWCGINHRCCNGCQPGCPC